MHESETRRPDGHVRAPGDLTDGVIVVFSGGPVDIMNPPEVLFRMDDLISEVNADPFVVSGTGGRGLTFVLIPHQDHNHIHQLQWPNVCDALLHHLAVASPLILVGHSNGGAAVVDLARCLQSQGKTVDLAFTADSVLTLNDNGNVNRIPTNVTLNVNSYVVPTLAWLLLPFPFGQRNERETGGIEGIVNIGLPFDEPGAIAHRDAFYDLAGGNKLVGGGSEFPEMIRQTILAVLRGETSDRIFQEAKANLQTLANDVRVPIHFETSNENTELEPAGGTKRHESRLPEESIGELRNTMLQLEAERLRATLRGARS